MAGEKSFEGRCKALLAELNLPIAKEGLTVRPLTGGVASDIAHLRSGDLSVCAKFALPKLKVAEDWRAPVHRNRAEYEWLRFAAEVAPGNAVRLFGCSPNLHGFAMEYLDGEDVFLWKTCLLKGRLRAGEAAAVGNTLGTIHAASTKPGFDASAFHNRDDFRALRIEPYLTFTGMRWPGLAPRLAKLAEQLYTNQQVLVHGDVSPKNILFRSGAPVLLDAECATLGDASFDPAFCVNHLLLKAIHLPASSGVMMRGALELWRGYAPHISWENPEELQARTAALIPALMLARVDGKSPVEYLTEAQRETGRRLAVPMIQSPPQTLEGLIKTVANATEEKSE